MAVAIFTLCRALSAEGSAIRAIWLAMDDAASSGRYLSHSLLRALSSCPSLRGHGARLCFRQGLRQVCRGKTAHHLVAWSYYYYRIHRVARIQCIRKSNCRYCCQFSGRMASIEHISDERLLMTLGLALILFAFVERWCRSERFQKWAQPIVIFGRFRSCSTSFISMRSTLQPSCLQRHFMSRWAGYGEAASG
jgi:hypothetical protein